MSELVSVCIPAYNEGRAIYTTLDSIARQRFDGDVEVLVCANGCTDNTEDEVRRFQRDHRNVELIVTPERGKPNAWNILRERSLGNVKIFADGDIYIDRDAFTALYCRLSQGFTGVGAMLVPYLDDVDFFSRILASPPTEFQSGLTGSLYIINNCLLQHRFEYYNYSGIPKDVIAEDCFLTGVVGKGNWTICADAKVYHRPHYWKDYPRTTKRFGDSLRQIKKDYPEIWDAFWESAYINTNENSLLRRRLKRLANTKGVLPKFRLLIRYSFVRYMAFYTGLFRNGSLNALESWESSESSKEPILNR